MSSALLANKDLLSESEYELCAKLETEYKQAHLFADWPAPGTEDADKARMAAQLMKLDKDYPGGLGQYVSNAVRLLRESNEGKNPFDGFVPSVPSGER
jgi:UDP-sugar pyrophosphorylase